MPTTIPKPLLEVAYESAAQAYLRSLPPEHFMEATAQATQRKITLESFDLVHARRKDVHCFNELLVQYPLLPERPGKRSFGQVVPDNMVVISEQPLNADSSFNVPLEPAKPFWMLEYVSKHNERKDYKESFDKYERELKVPYYLLFYPDNQDLILYRHNGKKYVAVKPNKENRYEVRDLNIEVALLDGWVRFWHEGVILRRICCANWTTLDAASMICKSVSMPRSENWRDSEANRRNRAGATDPKRSNDSSGEIESKNPGK
jgi:Uma2 family endonuclease